ncbi:hypothetical protein JM93_02595 [Roseibium hamelinense]|uniref:DUF3617 family protein n=1 Tax=Roseibium hamelinense TaxID=150831 RepID=A0A562T202_9HYPH|nr:hypothetical protein [Roseibium hamelinense]MTI44723.1 hypothetical protein [Roseibium hamelinense]TWI87353.1 hypothetical protein JM93_02595 [Roseibium hamelinense]
MTLAIRQLALFCLAVASVFITSPVNAAKGDRQVSLPRSSPLLEGKVLDLRFAEFAQGIWAKDHAVCDSLTRIDRAQPGEALAIFRGLFEAPGQICNVYGAEHRPSRVQRAAMNCRLDSGGSALGLVTVQKRGDAILLVQDGEGVPMAFSFCRPIPPLMEPAGQSTAQD